MKILVVFFLILFFNPLAFSFFIEFEGGRVKILKNQLKIPNDSGTRFDTSLSRPNEFYYYNVSSLFNLPRNFSLRFLYSSLIFDQSRLFSDDILFEGETFSKSSETEIYSKFNSYQFTIRYQFIGGSFLTTYIGLTGKINDHQIRLTQGNKKKYHIDSGYIPLFYFGGGLKLTDFLSVLFDFDVVGSSQLQFAEGSTRIHAKYNSKVGFGWGYRVILKELDNNNIFQSSLISCYNFSFDYRF